jgi:hypothetical protein
MNMQPDSSVEALNSVVLIIGNTVLMDGIETCLQELQLKHLVHWDTINAESEKDLNTNPPKLIIFEQDAPNANFLLNFLKECPGTYLLGVDIQCQQVLVMNSFQIQTRSMSDLQRITQDIVGGRL